MTCTLSPACIYSHLLTHCYFVCFSTDMDYEYVTCGSVVKLLNTRFNARLHSHEIKYGSGSGQQVRAGSTWAESVFSGLLSRYCKILNSRIHWWHEIDYRLIWVYHFWSYGLRKFRIWCICVIHVDIAKSWIVGLLMEWMITGWYGSITFESNFDHSLIAQVFRYICTWHVVSNNCFDQFDFQNLALELMLHQIIMWFARCMIIYDICRWQELTESGILKKKNNG